MSNNNKEINVIPIHKEEILDVGWHISNDYIPHIIDNAKMDLVNKLKDLPIIDTIIQKDKQKLIDKYILFIDGYFIKSPRNNKEKKQLIETLEKMAYSLKEEVNFNETVKEAIKETLKKES